MAGKFSFSNFFGVGDEADDYQATAPTTAATSPTNNSPVAAQQSTPKVVAMQGGKSVNSKIALFEPRIYSDVKEIATQLINNQAVIVNFDQIADDQAKRIVDFLTGTVYAVEGDIERIGDQIFLCTPKNYEVSGNVSTKFSKSSF